MRLANVVRGHSRTLAQASLDYLELVVNQYRWVIVARACVIVTLGGFEAIHVGTDPYLPLGIGIALAGIAVGGFAFLKARALKR